MAVWQRFFHSIFTIFPYYILGNLYSSLDLNDTPTWSSFGVSAQPELEFPASVANKITPFQKVLLVQTLRPDRLQSAMNLFAAKSLGLKALATSTLNLKRLTQDTSPKEPILIIISPGTDPSQDLQELAVGTVGREKYHEVAMGQVRMAFHSIMLYSNVGYV